MSKQSPIISIVMTTYGHEKYIKYALDSILMQKTKYEFEVLIGEDCSPDSTREILKEYQKKNPDVFTVFYRETNFGGRKNSQDLVRRAKGKYIASLEGDDFWLSETYLQKCADFLQNNPEYMGCANKVRIVDENNKEITLVKYPECKKSEYSLKQFRRGFLPGQTASIMIRNVYKDNQFDVSIKQNVPNKAPGDRLTAFLWTANGRFRCMDEVTTAYRYIAKDGLSYSALSKKNIEEYYTSLVESYRMLIEHLETHNYSKEAIKTANSLYLYTMTIASVKTQQYSFKNVLRSINNVRYKAQTVCSYINIIMLFVFRRLFGINKRYLGW